MPLWSIGQLIFESKQIITNGAETSDAEIVFGELEKNIIDKYKIKVNPGTIRESDHIYKYIANEKLTPENAKGQVDRIKKAVLRQPFFIAAYLPMEYWDSELSTPSYG